MWKILLAFVVFAAVALLILTKSGGDVDMGGEKHGVETPPAAEPGKPVAPTATQPGSAAASAASP